MEPKNEILKKVLSGNTFTDFYITKNGKHTGLYTNDGKWIAWLKQHEISKLTKLGVKSTPTPKQGNNQMKDQDLLEYLEGQLTNQNYRLECLLKEGDTYKAYQQYGVIKYLQIRINEVNEELQLSPNLMLVTPNTAVTGSKLNGLLNKIKSQ